ncbi:MAG: hypothetical protein AB1546_05130 [bacterium]
MNKSITLKIESLKNQLEMLKHEIEDAQRTRKKGDGGLRKLKGILKGKVNFSDEDFAAAEFTFRDKL